MNTPAAKDVVAHPDRTIHRCGELAQQRLREKEGQGGLDPIGIERGRDGCPHKHRASSRGQTDAQCGWLAKDARSPCWTSRNEGHPVANNVARVNSGVLRAYSEWAQK